MPPLLVLGLRGRADAGLEHLSRAVLRHLAATQSLLMPSSRKCRFAPLLPAAGKRNCSPTRVRRGTAFWDATHFKMIEDDAEAVHRSGILDAIVQVLGRPDVQDLLMRLQLREFHHGPDRP